MWLAFIKNRIRKLNDFWLERGINMDKKEITDYNIKEVVVRLG